MSDESGPLDLAGLFADAADLPPQEREALLQARCGHDPALLARVARLLAHDMQSEGGFMVSGARCTDVGLPTSLRPGERVAGRYHLVRLVGEGGMGTVFEARQDNPHRRVALKVMRPDWISRRLAPRFRREVEVLGRLHHPGIAHIYEAGSIDVSGSEHPFFAMEFVDGLPLTDHAHRQRLSPRQRMGLVAEICDAVQHAHDQGVIHRDLKPANILVDESGRPRVLDFGVARATDADLQTLRPQTDIGQLIGTLPYMSPEQAAGDSSLIDARTDVYALGVILFELLAGRLPLDVRGKTAAEAARVIRDEDPSRLSRVDSSFRGDVDTIVAKAMEKEPGRRYASAAALAADIRRHLENRAIAAHPASVWYRVGKFARRNRAAAAALAGIVLVTTGGFIISTALWLQAVKASRNEADQRRVAEAVNTFLTEDLLAAVAPEQKGIDVTMRQVLDAAAERIGDRFKDDPLVEAQIRLTMGSTYVSLGEYSRAVPHLERAVSLRRRAFGDEHEQTLAAMVQLGIAYKRDSRFADAEPVYLRAIEISKELMGPNHEATLEVINNLAALYDERGQYERAEPLYRETLAGCEKSLGPIHIGTMMVMSNLAVTLANQSRYTEALSLHQAVLERRTRALGENHPHTLMSLNNIALALRSLDRDVEAEPMFRDLVARRREALGDSHPHTLWAEMCLAELLAKLERYSEGRDLMVSVWERSAALPQTHWYRGRFHRASGLNLAGLGQFEQAEAEFLRAYENLSGALGAFHEHARAAADSLASLYEQTGNTDGALTWRGRSEKQ